MKSTKNKRVIVFIAYGKGQEEPYKFKIKTFDSENDANLYIKKENNLDSKYWTRCEIIKEDVWVEPTKEEFYLDNYL